MRVNGRHGHTASGSQHAQPEVVVATGASAGIGRAKAEAFGRRDAKVALIACGRSTLAAASAAALGAAWGGALLAQPAAVLRRAGATDPSDVELSFARVLGARQLVQAVEVGRWPCGTGRIGAVVDVLHALSMAALALLSRERRRPALVSATVAVGLGLLEANGGERA